VNTLDVSPTNRSTAPSVEPLPRLALRMAEVVKSLGISRRTLERERSAGRFPPPDLHIGKAPLWRPETLRAWVERGGGK
jgi:predicted DNA-binding transcriptional regulator AlpA